MLQQEGIQSQSVSPCEMYFMSRRYSVGDNGENAAEPRAPFVPPFLISKSTKKGLFIAWNSMALSLKRQARVGR